MLSCLSRGVGDWSGDVGVSKSTDGPSRLRKCKSALPRLGSSDEFLHRHGVTVSSRLPSRTKSAGPVLRTATVDGQLALPKTYSTRKGALMLFTPPDADDYPPFKGVPTHYPTQKPPKGDSLIDLTLNIGTIQRLTWSVLQYGDKNFDPSTASVSDIQNRLFLKFLKSLPENDLEEKIKPGADLSFYLEKLKSSTCVNRFTRLSSPDVAELKSALEALDQSRANTPVQDNLPGTEEVDKGRRSRPGTAPLLSRRERSARSRVLSTEKLAASLKSNKHIDRSAPPKPPVPLAWSPVVDPSKSVENECVVTSDTFATDQSVKGKSGRALHDEAVTETQILREITLEKPDVLDDEAKLLPLCPNVSKNFDSPQNISEQKETDKKLQQELSPFLETPEVPTSAVLEIPTSQPTTHEEHTPDNAPPLTPSPSLLEILTETVQDVKPDNDDDEISEKSELRSNVSVSLPDFEQCDVDADTDKFRTQTEDDQTRISPEVLERANEVENDEDALDRETSTPTWGVHNIPESFSPHFFADNTSFLRSSSPVERPVPASSPVDFPCQTETNKSENNIELIKEDTRNERPELPVKDSDQSAGPVDDTTRSANVVIGGNIRGVICDPSPEIHAAENIVVNIPLPNSADSSSQSLAPGKQFPNTELSTLVPDRSFDHILSCTSTSEMSELKEMFSSDVDIKPVSSADVQVSDILITHYEPVTKDLPKSSLLKEDRVQSRETIQGHTEAKDVPFTSKSSLHSIRSVTSLPASPPPPPTSRVDQFPPSPPPSISPKPPPGPAPPKSRPVRQGSSKDSNETRGPPSPDTLVRTVHLDRTVPPSPVKPQSASKSRGMSATSRKNKRPKTGKGKKVVDEDVERLRREEKESAKRKLEIEVKLLEQQIRAKEQLRQEQMIQAERLRREYQLQLDMLEKEAAELRQAEEDAKVTMAMTRTSQREQRKQQRKEELERKKQLAIQNRQREKKMMESGRVKEMEMLESISDGEMRSNLVEKIARERDEEERLALERFEEEMKEAEILAEEQEERMRVLESQAEEEAMQRLFTEQEEIEKKKRSLLKETRKLDEEEEKLKQEIEAEHQRLEEEKRQIYLEDLAKMESEAERLKQIQEQENLEKDKMRRELDQKRMTLAKQRRKNYDMRMNLEKVRSSQGVTRPYVFSYFITWPREIYEKPMGGDTKKKRSGIRPKPKKSAK